ncbi:hypothetical protein EJP82_25955 [Paenibacillus anaericanus]|uniref:ABC transporter permease n=1 Tax=Paenibacillus anaericanus TaxID=170367 RepID=A0A3S1JY27_9BACL|nr:hypothetical protein [Paenibacillus anaericanus]RUT39527.1 hypothetical protein EJP82_25955 [Paenibacillus anaericanus]
MENISTGLKWAIGIIVTLLIIAAGISVYLVANGYFSRAQQQTTSQSQMLSQAEYSIYDNKNVTGKDVIDAATRYQDRPEFSVFVRTGLNASGYYTKNSYDKSFYNIGSNDFAVQNDSTTLPKGITTTQMTNPKDTANYINPTGVFSANIYRDKNGEVRLIEFTQNTQ